MSKPPEELYFLNTVRWISAFIVAGSHAAGLVFKHRPLGRANPWLENVTSYCSDLGHPAVIIFFVISGYLVGGGVLDRLDKFDVRFYAISRFSRIYIALVPTILLTMALDGLAYLIAPTNPVYTTGWSGPVNSPVFDHYTLQNFVATILTLESVIGAGSIGSNGPLWSLGYEWFFYILFPVALCVVQRFKLFGKYGSFLAVAGAALIMLALGEKYFAVFWMIWVLGAFAKQLADRTPVTLWASYLGGVVALLSFIATPIVNQRIADPIVGVGFALFLCNRIPLRASLHRTLDHALAHFSYSLYIVHVPVMVFAMLGFVGAGTTTTTDQLGFGVRGVLMWMTLMGVGIGVGYLFGQVFESRTDDLRRFLVRKFMGGPGSYPAKATAA